MIAPLNHSADKAPSSWSDGKVTTSPGFKEAFRQFGEAGWQGVQHPVEFGGQGLPKLLATPCIEMLNSANLSFALCPLLTDGTIEALMTAGSQQHKETFIANFRKALIGYVLLTALGCALLAWWAVRQGLKPLTVMQEKAARIGAGHQRFGAQTAGSGGWGSLQARKRGR